MNERVRPSARSKKNDSENVERCSTPTQSRNYNTMDRDYSPVFLPCTQESLEDVDVLWDWNSPQSKISHANIKKKRVHKAPSPKLPLKKSSSNNQLKTFEKLKEELRAFTKITKSNNNVKKEDFAEEDLFDDNRNELDDIFNDSIDQELLMVSQQIEEKLEDVAGRNVCKRLDLNSPLNSKGKGSPRNLLTKSFSSNALEVGSPIKRAEIRAHPTNFKAKMQDFDCGFDDSLENTLREVDISGIVSESKEKQSETNGVLKFKTKSLSFGDHYDNSRVNVQKNANTMLKAEIERKRLEALAKLRSKKKQEQSDSDTSPIKCSPEEIEMKRRQALAKLEAKKKQEIIEKNRLEALKRLEMNRRKRAGEMKALNMRNNTGS